MKWASTVATTARLEDAVAEASETLSGELGGEAADVVFAFASEDYAPYLPNLGGEIARRFPGALLFGCAAPGVIGDGREIEHEPALSLTAASLPGVELAAYHLGPEPERWSRALASSSGGDLIVLSDPITGGGPALVEFLDAAMPEAIKIGGMTGAKDAGESSLLVGDRVHRTGSIALSVRGNVDVSCGVAQGCRPIGTPMFVTRHRGPLILELDGKPALRALDGMFAELSSEDRDMARSRLVLGLVMRGGREVYEQGDFLIRELAGVEPETGAVVVAGAPIEDNQVLQFHLRDAETSSEELAAVLDDHIYAEPAGALLFQCRGRGRGLYNRADHDSSVLVDKLGAVPVGGFFAGGEIGPVGGKTFLHTYTTVFGLFRAKR